MKLVILPTQLTPAHILQGAEKTQFICYFLINHSFTASTAQLCADVPESVKAGGIDTVRWNKIASVRYPSVQDLPYASQKLSKASMPND